MQNSININLRIYMGSNCIMGFELQIPKENQLKTSLQGTYLMYMQLQQMPIKKIQMKQKYLHFRSSQCLNHESIILRQKKDTTTFPWRRKFPQSIISTNGHHIVSSINLEQLSQISATGHKIIYYNNHT